MAVTVSPDRLGFQQCWGGDGSGAPIQERHCPLRGPTKEPDQGWGFRGTACSWERVPCDSELSI